MRERAAGKVKEELSISSNRLLFAMTVEKIVSWRDALLNAVACPRGMQFPIMTTHKLLLFRLPLKHNLLGLEH
jgi:hypothetical protein